MKFKSENKKIKNIFRRWLAAIAWGLIGYGVAGIISIGYLKFEFWNLFAIGEISFFMANPASSCGWLSL